MGAKNIPLYCFKCDEELPAVSGSTAPMQPSGGVDAQVTGNYGSAVFNPCGEDAVIVLHICDGCLSAHADRVHLFLDGKRAGRKRRLEYLRR